MEQQELKEARVWDRDAIKQLVTTRDEAAVKALLIIYSKQTEAEKCHDHTSEDNGVGFSKVDSEILSSFAKFYERAGFLTDKQLALLKKRIGKYWKQLLRAAEEKGQMVSYKVPRAGKA